MMKGGTGRVRLPGRMIFWNTAELLVAAIVCAAAGAASLPSASGITLLAAAPALAGAGVWKDLRTAREGRLAARNDLLRALAALPPGGEYRNWDEGKLIVVQGRRWLGYRAVHLWVFDREDAEALDRDGIAWPAAHIYSVHSGSPGVSHEVTGATVREDDEKLVLAAPAIQMSYLGYRRYRARASRAGLFEASLAEVRALTGLIAGSEPVPEGHCGHGFSFRG